MRGSRAAATATAIEEAALDLALDRGYDQVTVDLICERVGVSQRTFFNHFPTKDDALLGRDRPQVDERAARRFVVSDGPLLLDALTLVELPTEGGSHHRIADRMRVISSSPSLLNRQMGRIAAIDEEITEIIALRLRHQHPDQSEQDLADEASLSTHVLAGVLRWIGSHTEGEGSSPEVFGRTAARARHTLHEVLRNSTPPTGSTHQDRQTQERP